MELDRTGGQFKLTTFSRPVEASQCKIRLTTLSSIGQVQRGNPDTDVAGRGSDVFGGPVACLDISNGDGTSAGPRQGPGSPDPHAFESIAAPKSYGCRACLPIISYRRQITRVQSPHLHDVQLL